VLHKHKPKTTIFFSITQAVKGITFAQKESKHFCVRKSMSQGPQKMIKREQRCPTAAAPH